jgi:hypothetical protein
MPSLDFSRVIGSRFFRDTFYLIKVSRIVGQDGVETDQLSNPVSTRGIVIPGEMSSLRDSEGARVAAFIEVITKTKLSPGFKSTDVASREGDLINWHGNSYRVMAVEDFSAFGRGFYKASCDLKTLSSAT